jgi:hypothetical protein
MSCGEHAAANKNDGDSDEPAYGGCVMMRFHKDIRLTTSRSRCRNVLDSRAPGPSDLFWCWRLLVRKRRGYSQAYLKNV